MARITKTSILSAALLALACSSNNSSSSTTPIVVKDTLGNSFSISCATGFCILTPTDSTLTAYSCSSGYGSGGFVLLWSRVLRIHAMNLTSGSAYEYNMAEPSRPVACTADTDCSVWNGAVNNVDYKFTCVNSMCQAVSVNLSANDVIALCQADIPWPSACPYITTQPFASRMAEIGALCEVGKPCSTVPPDCRQPTASSPIDGGATPVPGIDAGTTPAPAMDSGTTAVDGGLGLL